MRSLSESDKRNKKLMIRLYRYHWNILKLNPTLRKDEACARTLTENGFERFCYVNCHCFLCAYMVAMRGRREFECNLCPIKWLEFKDLAPGDVQGMSPCEKSHYGRWVREKAKIYKTTPSIKCASFLGELSRIAGVISRLPEKEGS